VHQPANPVTPGLKLLGSVPWLDAVVQSDPHSVSVSADIDKTPGLVCIEKLPVLKADADETGTSVTIRVQAYLPASYQTPTPQPGTISGCTVMGHHPVPLLVSLHDPIGARTLVDASTGQHHSAGVAVQLPSPTSVPAGYVDDGISEPSVGGVAEHGYRNGDTMLSLIRSAEGQLVYRVNPNEIIGTVLGQPAKVGSYGSPPGQIRCATWSDPSYSWQLCSYGIGISAVLLPATELLTVANSIR
jgi:hypothetical protein